MAFLLGRQGMSRQVAEQYFEQGRWREAVQQARLALRAQPGDPALLRILAASCAQSGDDPAAAEAYDSLIGLEPNVAEHWMNRGTVRRALGQLPEAESDYRRAADLGASGAGFLFNRGLLSLDRQDPIAACDFFQAASAQDLREAEFAYFHAESLFLLLRLDSALAVASRWRQWENLSLALLPRLGNLLFQLGAAEEGEQVLKLALLMEPEDEDGIAALVGLLERSNRLPEAESYWQLLQSRPTADARQQTVRQLLGARLAQRRGDHPVAITMFEAARRTSGAEGASDLWFGLAKSQDALGQADAAMSSLRQAHARQLNEIALIRPTAVRAEQAFGIADYPSDPDDAGHWYSPVIDQTQPSPLFVVAFPRSGTTLLEQMLDAHPGMGAMDEQPFLQLAIDDIQSRGGSYPERLASLGPEDHSAVRRRYFERVASRVRLAPGQRLVDKNPLNLLRLPAIRWLFPDATVVLVLRHPCDVLLSCHLQQFRAPEFAVLCRSLESLALGYVRAFDFFYSQQALLQARVMELRYENLVSDVEHGTRALCEFAGLPWDAAMLNPARHARSKAYISTPSYTQVIQPISRQAVDRWRRYASYFQPVMPILQPYLERWGYEGL